MLNGERLPLHDVGIYTKQFFVFYMPDPTPFPVLVGRKPVDLPSLYIQYPTPGWAGVPGLLDGVIDDFVGVFAGFLCFCASPSLNLKTEY
ncbi:MAG TPA: hypothetical protein DD687_18490 [Verrucomicrobiales bacterium]|nr:hypothetical protein [Verrucomicrobiales bacterium]